ncbi:glycoside hydrolase family 2 protein [Sphingobacterium bovistauri]|uniref:Beta-galactosidase n=1 Tax=Sphingobacterium bovistauri TaxID=2781959 RepID=A0ABS7Z564_9SPHI|nr:sugar-binding domain-containing protein [Sphingobacterium bovistauri]MCA5005331.1 beta-galactosidase [Sphingobacterium bovistauri]
MNLGKLFLLFFSMSSMCYLNYAQEWSPVGDRIKTPWAEKVNPKLPHPEYPRPQLVRDNNWKNLNGLWSYKITAKEVSDLPKVWDGKILVPFSVESSLSGVGKRLTKDEVLWYHNDIIVPNSMRKGRVLLHFGAVDWRSEIFVNGKLVETHEGGFNAFNVDITAHLVKGTKQEIAVKVWDPTDQGPQPRGKQVDNPHGIWYTPVSGIWQTVWIESVPETYILNTKHTPDVDNKRLIFKADIAEAKLDDHLVIEALDGKEIVATQKAKAGEDVYLSLLNVELWSPSNPKLYDLKIRLIRNGKVIDQARSYFAMRKISKKADNQGVMRMYLNDEFVFHYGPLDQGWWPDGLHTAPSDEALKFDVIKTKEMGFNMIRKHIKVEPARWYRHCDSIGVLVWQDMPSGDLGGNVWDMHPGKISGGLLDKIRSIESEAIYRKEWKIIMDQLHNFPSIVVWVPFNEAWGQFKSKEIVDWTSKYDSSRLINGASGGNYQAPGDIFDIHNYPVPVMPDPSIYGKDYVLVLGEFGGLGLPIESHTWQQKDNWGYQSFKNKEELREKYESFTKTLVSLIDLGLSGAVYTQTTDVEIETNGLMTYDRKVIKIPKDELFKMHQKLYRAK